MRSCGPFHEDVFEKKPGECASKTFPGFCSLVGAGEANRTDKQCLGNTMKNSLQRARDDSLQHSRASGGFTFMEFLCVLGVISALAAVFLLPALQKREARSGRTTCGNNLKQISLALRQWALDNGDKFPSQVSVTNGGAMEANLEGSFFVNFLVMSNELNTPKVLFCPGETEAAREPATTWGFVVPPGQVPFTNGISYFIEIGIPDSASAPQRILIGDANLDLDGKRVEPGTLVVRANSTLTWAKPYRAGHGKGGNVGLADGSVSSLSDRELRALVRQTGTTNNVWGIP